MPAWLLAALLVIAAPAMALPTTAPPAIGNDARVGPAELLTMPDELRARFDAEVVSRTSSPGRRLELMMSFLFDDSGLGMEYAADATHDVAEAFRTRKANCLSFTLLTIALARQAGFTAYGQQLDQILSWHQQDNSMVLSNHVNAGIVLQQRHYIVDVARENVIARGLPQRLDDAQLAALYHSNRAMELVLAGYGGDALPHIVRSLELDPRSATLWNNAGVAHLRNGADTEATAAYARAVELDPRHSGALFNLAQAYRRAGEEAAAERLLVRAQRILERDPFHHFLQGYAAEQDSDLDAAQAHYRRAIRLHGREHRFHFALARVHARLGDAKGAVHSLQHARKLGGDAERAQYQSKLDLLQAHRRD